MLDVLLGAELYNTAVVVTRYFGGILLGTGGLVRAYSGATAKGLAASTIIEKIYGTALEISTDYNGYGKLQYLAEQNDYAVLDTEFAQDVKMKLLVSREMENAARKLITEATNGRADIQKAGEMYYAKMQGQILTF